MTAAVAIGLALTALFWPLPQGRLEPTLVPSFSVPQSVRMLMVGDIMADRTLWSIAQEKGWDFIFSCITPVLSEYDVVVGNLEGPITEYPSVSVGTTVGEEGNTRFTHHPSFADALRRSGVGVVSIANNHIRDFGREGVAQTRMFLDSAGIVSFGDPGDPTHHAMRVRVREHDIVFVGFNEFIGDSARNAAQAVEQIELAQDIPTVVFAHWGDEYVGASPRVREWARLFVHAGADAVIGAHPHVVQEKEFIGRAPVFYSLGNFLFDQYWNDAVRTGLGVELEVSSHGVSVLGERSFTLMRDGRTCPWGGE